MDSKILIRIVWILIIILCIVLKKSLKNPIKKEEHFDESNDNLAIDSGIDFGFKMQWYAIKTSNKRRIAEILKLKKISNCNWETGIKKAYSNSIFITPQIGQWTLVCGHGFPSDTEEKLLINLSNEFGEAQFFATHRVVNYHCWMKAISGTLVRSFIHCDEYENGYISEGMPTKIEQDNELTLQADIGFEDIDFVDEEFVMKIAENWSVDPTELSQRKDIKHELGIVGII